MDNQKDYNKIRFLYKKKKEYLESLRDLNKDLIATIDKWDERIIKQYFISRDIIYNSLNRVDRTLLSISGKINQFKDSLSVINDIVRQDRIITMEISNIMQEISGVLIKIKKYEKYLSL